MTLLPPFFLDAVVAVGSREDESGTATWTASGFLFGELLSEREGLKDYSTYLVTNRHVLEGKDSVVLRFNPVEAVAAREFDVDLLKGDGTPEWVGHPIEAIDVGVLPLDFGMLTKEGIQFNWFRSDDHALDRAKALELGISEGDGVFVLGFPMGQVGGDRNYVIVRQGAVARIRDWLADSSEEFLVDVAVFPGNSGGPVVNRPDGTAIRGTKSLRAAMLLGVVASYVPYEDAAISVQTGLPRVIFQENSGLASVVPIDFARAAMAIHIASNPDTPEAETHSLSPEEPAPHETKRASQREPARRVSRRSASR